MYSTSDFRNGLKILLETLPYEIVYFQHVKPGKGGAFVRTKLKNLLNGAVVEKTFRAGEKLAVPDVQDVDMQYLYNDGSFHFMHMETFEQIQVPSEIVGDRALWLKENTLVRVLLFNGSVISIELPAFIQLMVTDCDPGLKGDTVSGATKPAKLETGASVQVPLFICQGDTLKIDTRTGQYVERV
jgi:elongation factor P